MPFRIVHAITPAPVGGLETAVRLLACGQAKQGHSVHVVATLDRPDTEPAVVAALRDSGISVSTVIAPGRAYMSEWRAMSALVARIRPHVLHTHGYRADLLAGAVARHFGTPSATTLHGFVGGDWKLRLYERLQRRSLKRFDAVIAVSARMGEALTGRVAAGCLHVIPNAFAAAASPMPRTDARRALGIPANRFELGWVGRLSHEKGPDVMIRALAAPESAGARLSIIGDGPERTRTMALARELGVADRVTFHGVRHDAAALLKAFDGVVLSSRTEGTPIVLLEALAAGTPVIATAVGGIPDVVQAEHALLVPAENTTSLAEAIGMLRAYPGAAAERARRASARLRDAYAVEPWVRAYDRVYRQIAPMREPLVA